MGARRIRRTWDALASDSDVYVGDPDRGRQELESLFGRLGADPRGGTCIEVGCGSGRMTALLADRFDHVIALDVSPAMLDRARAAVGVRDNVEFRTVTGERLNDVRDASADVLVCYLVLQHLPRRALVARFLREFARVLASNGEAFIQLPVLEPGVRPRLWRVLRSLAVPVGAIVSRRARHQPAFRGVRLEPRELGRALASAGLRPLATDLGPEAPYRFSRDLFLRLTHA